MTPTLILGAMSFCFLSFGYLGVPVPFALLAGVFVGAMLTDVSLPAIVQKVFDGVDNEALLAIPFFLLVGELMSSANVVQRVANLSLALVGHMRGGLSQVVTVFSMFFSEMSGSTTADVAVISRALGGPMKKEGYKPPFIAAIIAAASTIAALVPPSITAVVYGAVGNVSIAGLFMAGVVPGLMIGFGLMLYCYFFGPAGMRRPRASLREVAFAAREAALPMMIPIILLGGILTGWFTPTEAGVVAVLWILIVIIPALYRGHIAKLPYDFCLAGLIFSLPLITIGAANAFGWMLAYLRGAIVIAEWIVGIAGNDPHHDHASPCPPVHGHRRFHRAGADHHHLHAAGERAHPGGGHQSGAYGRCSHCDPRLRADHAAVWSRPAHGLEIRRGAVFPGTARRSADLCGFLHHHRIRYLFPQSRAVVAQAGHPDFRRLLQGPRRAGLHLPAMIAAG